MKHLKTIIGTLVLAVFFVGCQANDEIIELQPNSQTGRGGLGFGDSNGGSTGNVATTDIFILFDEDASQQTRQTIRDKFAQEFTFENIITCDTRREVWQVQEITAIQFLQSMMILGYIDYDPTLTDEENEDDVPPPPAIDAGRFLIKYGEDCSYLSLY